MGIYNHLMDIYHGEDEVKSREALNAFIDKIPSHTKLDASEVDIAKLRQLTENTDLFGDSPTIVIYGIFALTTSKKKDSLISFLVTNQTKNIILYEDKPIHALTLKKFDKAKVNLFEPPKVIFSFVENLRGGKGESAIKELRQLVDKYSTDPHFIFAMIIRQFRLMLSADNLPVWMKNKIEVQKKSFVSEEKILDLYQKLYFIDKRLKTSMSQTDMEGELLNFFLYF